MKLGHAEQLSGASYPRLDFTHLTPVEANRIIIDYALSFGLTESVEPEVDVFEFVQNTVAGRSKSLETVVATLSRFAKASLGVGDITAEDFQGKAQRPLHLAWKIIDGCKSDADPEVRRAAHHLERSIINVHEGRGSVPEMTRTP